MTGVDRMVTETLARVADSDVHVERLLAGARSDGLRYRRRRRLLGAGLGVVAAVSVVAAVLPGRPAVPAVVAAPTAVSVSSAAPAPSPSPSAVSPLGPPPAASGAPSALDDPSQVGRPLLFHITLERMPFPATIVQYASFTDGGERLNLQGSSGMLTVRVARTTTDFEPLEGQQKTVTVGGRQGTFAYSSQYGSGTLRWRLANSLYVQVAGQLQEADTLAVAASVRLDREYSCGVPFRLPTAPAGARVDSCNLAYFADRGRSATATIALGSAYVTFAADPGNGPSPSEVNETLGGRPARVLEHPGDGGHQIMEVWFSVGGGTAVSVTAEGPYNAATVRDLAAHLQWTGGTDLLDPLARS